MHVHEFLIHAILQVTTKTNLPAFRKSNYNVSRRFSDFLGLHRKLVTKHMVAGRIVPPAPEKSAMGAMGVKLSKEDQTSQVTWNSEILSPGPFDLSMVILDQISYWFEFQLSFISPASFFISPS